MTVNRRRGAAALLGLAMVGGAVQAVPGRKQEKEALTQPKFNCNTKALNPSERAHHKLLTDKLVAKRTRIVETEKGYEFQYSPRRSHSLNSRIGWPPRANAAHSSDSILIWKTKVSCSVSD